MLSDAGDAIDKIHAAIVAAADQAATKDRDGVPAVTHTITIEAVK